MATCEVDHVYDPGCEGNEELALLRMMMDMGEENMQPSHMVIHQLPYVQHFILGVIICGLGRFIIILLVVYT